jgi:hypothetical protein
MEIKLLVKIFQKKKSISYILVNNTHQEPYCVMVQSDNLRDMEISKYS